MKAKGADLEAPRMRWMVEPRFDDDGVQRSSGVDEYGFEHPDPVPLRPPVGLSVSQEDSVHKSIRELVRAEMFRQRVEAEGFETFEESDDFDVEDDYFPVDPHTPYEAVFDPPPPSQAARVGEEGRSGVAAPAAPNGQSRGPEEPTGQPSTSQVTPSSDSPLPTNTDAVRKVGASVKRSER